MDPIDIDSPKRTHFIKCRFRGERRWRFMTPLCDTNWLRVHAARMTKADADEDVLNFTKANPGVKFKATRIAR